MKQQVYKVEGAYLLRYSAGALAEDMAGAPFHYDEELCLSYFKHGTGSVKIEGRHYEIGEGDLILLSSYELHKFTFAKSDFHERITLYIKKALLSPFPAAADAVFSPFFQREKGRGNLIPASALKSAGIDALFDAILAEAKKETPEGEMLAACKAIELLSRLKEAQLRESTQQVSPVCHNSKIAAVIEYLNEAFREEITVDTVAARFFISKYHLCRTFKENTGVPLWEYIIRRRLLYFNDCVKAGASFEDACFASGFRNYSNFFRLYKKHMHMTPKEFSSRTSHIR